VLSACTGIAELGWWSSKVTTPVVAALDPLALRRLSVDTSFDFTRLPSTTFATITHLDMTFHNQYFQLTFPPLEGFLALTHFSVAHGSVMPPATWCDDVLKACPRLQILLRFSDTLYYEELSGVSPRHRDLRVVVMLQPVGAWTASWVHDAWPLAENVVRERRAHAAGA
jgi:hypothetical protein